MGGTVGVGSTDERTYRIKIQTIGATVVLCAELAVAAVGTILMLADKQTDLAGALRMWGFIGVFAWGTWAGFLRPRVVLTPETVRVVNMLSSVEFGHARMTRAGFTSEDGLVFRLDDRTEHRSTAFSGGKSASISRPGAERLLADLETLTSSTAPTPQPDRGRPRRVRSWAATGSGLLVLGTLVSSFVA